MLQILLVFEADELQQLCVDHQQLVQRHRPGAGVRLRIVNGDLDVNRTEPWPPKLLGQLCRVRDHIASKIEPQSVAQAIRLNDERVAVPMTGRVAVPAWIGIVWERASVGEDLAIAEVTLVEDDKQPCGLNDLSRVQVSVREQRTQRQAAR